MNKAAPVPGILKALQSAPGKIVSGGALAQKSGVSRAAVHKQVARLRALGYGITGAPRKGYQLTPYIDSFDATQVKNPWRAPLFHEFDITSTQDSAKMAAQGTAREGTIFTADKQSGGRGRLGRAWQSPLGGLWYSLILRPQLLPTQTQALSLVAGLTWASLLRGEYGIEALVKWPNDIWVDGKKVAGVLTEMSAEFGRVHWMVMGVGVNVNNDPPAKIMPPAGALKDILKKPIRRHDLLSQWLAVFAPAYRRYQTKGFAAFQKKYEESMLFRGQTLRFDSGGLRQEGRLLGVTSEGHLVLDTPAGRRSFQEGEISLTKF
jgi:BirA family biotin operon repressor/biotin-[acetyl-CoA-carboxylase] ligase